MAFLGIPAVKNPIKPKVILKNQMAVLSLGSILLLVG